MLVLSISALLGGSCSSGGTPGFSAIGGSPASGGTGAGSGAVVRTPSGGADADGDAGEAGGDAEPSTAGAARGGASGSSAAGNDNRGGSAGRAGGSNAGTAGASSAGTAGANNAGTAGASTEDCQLATYQGHTYGFCGGAASAAAARSKCEALGMSMVAVESAGENAFVLASMSGNSWLGASDEARQQRWLWLATDMPFWDDGPLDGAYHDFMPGNPNNNGANQTNEDCLVIFGGGPNDAGHWNDLSCDFGFYQAACESKPP